MITHIRVGDHSDRALCGSVKRFLYASEVTEDLLFPHTELCEDCENHEDFAMYVLAHTGEEPPRLVASHWGTRTGRIPHK